MQFKLNICAKNHTHIHAYLMYIHIRKSCISLWVCDACGYTYTHTYAHPRTPKKLCSQWKEFSAKQRRAKKENVFGNSLFKESLICFQETVF